MGKNITYVVNNNKNNKYLGFGILPTNPYNAVRKINTQQCQKCSGLI
jgi:hypothetical protein